MTPTPEDIPHQSAERPTAERHDLPRDLLFPALRSEPESFPVLKAFQEYLEEERERARKRLVTVSAIAITALVLVVAGFLAVGVTVIGTLSRRNDQLQDIVIRAATRELAPSAVAERSERPATELALLRESVQRLQADNAQIQSRVSALQDLPTTLAASVGSALSNLTLRSAAPTPPASPSSAAPVRRALPPPAPAPFAPSFGAVAAPAPSSAPDSTAIAAKTPVVAPSAPVSPAPSPDRPSARSAQSDRTERIAVSLPPVVREPLRIEGYAPAQITLVTDRGIRIPWRIVLPE